MACGGCSKNKVTRSRSINREDNAKKVLFGDYKYLSNHQIEARLASYKRKFCKDCKDRYDCNYASFLKCKDGE